MHQENANRMQSELNANMNFLISIRASLVCSVWNSVRVCIVRTSEMDAYGIKADENHRSSMIEPVDTFVPLG